MVQILPQDPTKNVWGNIGRGFGESLNKNLSEQLPKEVERTRLARGLKELGQQPSSQNPYDQLAGLYSIPGMTESKAQQLAPLLREQQMRNNYGKQGTATQAVEEGQKAKILEAQANQATQQPQVGQQNVKAPSDYATPAAMAVAGGAIQPISEARQEALTKNPWSKERRNQEIADVFENFPSITLDQATAMAADNESRDLAQPEAEKARDVEREAVKVKADDAFQKSLETKLQKKGENTYNDLSGEVQESIKRKMYRDITNGMPTDQAANKWSQVALDQGKAKTGVLELSHQNLVDSIWNKKETFKKLKEYGDIYGEAGNREGLYEILKTMPKEEIRNERGEIEQASTEGYGMSPQGAAYVAYPLSKSASSGISKAPKITNFDSLEEINQKSRKAALDVEKYITSQDSLLAIAKHLKMKDPNFNESAFFDQISEDKQELRLNPRQKRELGKGVSSVLPNWGDLWIIPFGGE